MCVQTLAALQSVHHLCRKERCLAVVGLCIKVTRMNEDRNRSGPLIQSFGEDAYVMLQVYVQDQRAKHVQNVECQESVWWCNTAPQVHWRGGNQYKADMEN